jgi:SAM-dependent methyltransferase
MAERAGPGGRVLATDVDPRWLQTGALPQLEVLAHNVTSDPLPEAAFDLIHERLVLVHLPSRDAVLNRLATALKPGGWLVLEEFGNELPICLDPVNDDERTFNKVGHALAQALHSRGPTPPGAARCLTG